MLIGQPAPERLVVHVTQPGKDPVTTVPFVLYPTYGNDGKVSYGNTAPEFNKAFKDPPLGLGGSRRIDPASSPRAGDRFE